MAFNPNDYAKNSGKPFVQRAVDPAVSSATNNLAASTRNIAQSTAEGLFIAGATAQSMATQAGIEADIMSSSASDAYYAMANKSVARATRSEIANARKSDGYSSSSYVDKTAPQTKIRRARQGKGIRVITVR